MSRARPQAVIAGAGIGGLTAALALGRAGLSVLVLERARELSEAGAGVQLSPNATRILARLGLLERLQEAATTPQALRIRNGHSGRELAVVEMGTAAQRRWGAPNIVLHRADLQRILLAEVARVPTVALETDAEVAGFAAAVDGVAIAAKRGNVRVAYKGEVLIGADGLRSIVRQRLNDHPGDAPVYSGRTAWRALIAPGALPSSRGPETGLWLGRRAHLVHYPLRDGALNVVALVQDPNGKGAAGLSFGLPSGLPWSEPGEPRVLARHFQDWAPAAKALISAVPEWRTWPLFERPPLRRWSVGRVTLLGDAAHPLMPFLAQGAAQAIEDAAALAQALQRAGADPAAGLQAYERARIARATRIQRQSQRQGRIYHLSGPMALARDMVMRSLGPERLMARYDWVYGHRG